MSRAIPLVLAVLLTAAPARAQRPATAPAPLRAGDRMRARVVGPAGGGADAPVGLLCETRLATTAGDTLVAADRGCPRGAYLADVEVYRGDRGGRGAHAVVGAVAGGLLAAGGLLLAAHAGDGGESFPLAVAGGAVGALVGALAGASMPAGPQWTGAGAARPVRVAGLAVRPAVRFTVRTVSRGTP